MIGKFEHLRKLRRLPDLAGQHPASTATYTTAVERNASTFVRLKYEHVQLECVRAAKKPVGFIFQSRMKRTPKRLL